jgi:uncharacterized protein YPO0396
MQQLSLDRLDERQSGFRLQVLEVYNWGTFNHQVWKMTPYGSTALLTGANGSGKSTLVDALLTLLVPNLKRNYNQASGNEKRRERDEKSYVLGAYGRVKDEANSRGIVQYLRDKKSYTVLLASFHNERLRQTVSLAQVFYWRDDELRKFYLIAQRQLEIVEHLQLKSTPDELRKRLRSLGVEVFDEFSRYSAKLVKLFGLRSEKALDLFNQTVSIKEIGGLNEFVRQHMLEKTDAGEKIVQLQETYENLTRAHDAIAKAEKQIAALQPLLNEADQHQQLQARISETERCAEYVPFYLARRQISLCDQAISTTQHDLDQQRSQAVSLQNHVAGLRQQEISLNVTISKDSVGQQIQTLQQNMTHAQERRTQKKKNADKYAVLVRPFQFTVGSDQTSFFENRRRASEGIASLDNLLKTLVTQRDSKKQDEGRLRAVCQELERELASLRQRKSQIPAEDLQIRERLANALDLDSSTFPFVGELLKVRDNAREWEGAIERLLRGYARQLLVPEAYYSQVNGYVDQTNLRGRLVYQRVNEQRRPRSGAGEDDDLLFFKLEIKPDTAFHDWLKSDLLEHWDYICCTTLEQFQRERRGITRSGQVKSGGTRHEKDDRFNLNDRTRYVLGWDNRDKIAALEAELKREHQQLNAVKAEINKLEQEQTKRSEQWQQLREILTYDDFAAIDWHTEERQLAALNEQLRDLEASSNQLQRLRDQLTQVKAELQQHEADLQRTQTVITTYENDIKRCQQLRNQSQAKLATLTPHNVESLHARLDEDTKKQTVTLDGIADLHITLTQLYNRSANAQRGNVNALEKKMTERIVNFRRDYPEDSINMDASLEALGEFRQLYERLVNDDLPTYRKRFKEWLDGKVVEAIVEFQSALNTKVEEYRESITKLNEALHTIDYTPSTYIKLTSDQNRDQEICDFRQTLRECIPNVAQRSSEANEQSFQRIRALISRFEKEERWTAKVTDVRNWLDFAAEERYREDDTVKHFYSDSSGKSGGQKAKLAYTILASAIAYQYGLDQDEQLARTFRFVVVDEAFSKSDENNARYAMSLFQQLNLQLLVVTPLDKTHVVEPHIAACHFISNAVTENDSRVHNLTIQQYYDQKAAFAQLAQVAE